MRRLLFLLILTSAAAVGSAQTIAQYLQMRRVNGIKAPISASTLDTMIGSRVVEVSGTIKGSFKIDDHGAILLGKADGSTQIVDCKTVPDWLTGSEVQARLMLRISRADETSEVKAELLGAAPENLVAPHDRGVPPKPSKPTKAALTSRNGARTSKKQWILPASQVTPIYAAFIKSRNKRLTDAEAMEIAREIIGFSIAAKIDARLIMAMVLVESGFNPAATSRHGAQGLGQLMPGTAAGLGVGNAYDTQQNLAGMVTLVRGNLDKYKAKTGEDFRSLVLALAAYNAGGGAVDRHGGVPPYAETQNYVVKVMSLYRAFTKQD